MHPKRLLDARQRRGAAVKEKRYAATDVVVPARRGAAVSPEAARDDHAGVTDQYRALKRERDALVKQLREQEDTVDEARRVVERARRAALKASNRP